MLMMAQIHLEFSVRSINTASAIERRQIPKKTRMIPIRDAQAIWTGALAFTKNVRLG